MVFFSSGIGAWAAAKRVVAAHGTDNLTLLFADTLIEDEDNYRFLEEAATNVGGKLVKVSDGRDPWQVFKDKRWIGNSRVAQCSHILKQEQCRKWLSSIDTSSRATLYVGIDWSEIHRLPTIQKHWLPWQVEAPLTEPPYLDKFQLLKWASTEGLKPPRLYDYSFNHANCGGFCVRGGQAHFANLLRHFPERYRYHEQKEEELREYLERDVSILRNSKDGEKKPLTLRQLRERIELENQLKGEELKQLNIFDDWGRCGCFTQEISDEN